MFKRSLKILNFETDKTKGNYNDNVRFLISTFQIIVASLDLVYFWKRETR